MEGFASVRDRLINELLDHLYQEDFSLKSITDFSRMELLVSPLELLQAEDDAYRRYRKYIQKRVVEKGIKLDAMARRSIYEGIRDRCYIDLFVRSALCFLGIAGSERVNYNRVAYKIVKMLKRQKVEDWPRSLERAKIFWEDPVKLDPRPAKIVTVLTAKVYYQLKFGKLRLSTITRDELYPEQSDDYMTAFMQRPIPSLEEPQEQQAEQSLEKPEGKSGEQKGEVVG